THAVQAAHERLTVTLPGRTLKAGEKVPLTVRLAGAATPDWRVWLRSLDEVDYRELTWREGMLEVPGDLCGIYLLKVTPEVQPWQRGNPPEYQARTWIEVKARGDQAMSSTGTLSIWTTSRRSRFAQGETIPLQVQSRSSNSQQVTTVKLRLI